MGWGCNFSIRACVRSIHDVVRDTAGSGLVLTKLHQHRPQIAKNMKDFWTAPCIGSSSKAHTGTFFTLERNAAIQPGVSPLRTQPAPAPGTSAQSPPRTQRAPAARHPHPARYPVSATRTPRAQPAPAPSTGTPAHSTTGTLFAPRAHAASSQHPAPAPAPCLHHAQPAHSTQHQHHSQHQHPAPCLKSAQPAHCYLKNEPHSCHSCRYLGNYISGTPPRTPEL